MKRFIKLPSVLTLSLVFSVIFTSLALASEKDCGCTNPIEDTREVLGNELEKAVAVALDNQGVRELINVANNNGYKLNVSEAVAIENSAGQLNVVLPMYKTDLDYKAVIYNSTGFSTVISVKDSEVHFGIDEGEAGTEIFCLGCSAACYALIGNPAAFFSCVALCAALCAVP